MLWTLNGVDSEFLPWETSTRCCTDSHRGLKAGQMLDLNEQETESCNPWHGQHRNGSTDKSGSFSVARMPSFRRAKSSVSRHAERLVSACIDDRCLVDNRSGLNGDLHRAAAREQAVAGGQAQHINARRREAGDSGRCVGVYERCAG